MKAAALRAPTLLLSLLPLVWTACSDSSGPPRVGPPAELTIVAGTPQDGESGEPLAQPLAVRVTDRNGRGVPASVVSFVIGSGGGSLSATQDTTDKDGHASVVWTMGPQLGAAQAEARVNGIATPAVFNATVRAGPPAAVQRTSALIGNSAGGYAVADSVAVKLVDRFGNAIPGAAVTFSVAAGGGAVAHATRTTGSDGVARTAWTLGPNGTQSLRASHGAFETVIAANAIECAATQLALGQVLTVAPGTPNCVTLDGSARKYLVSVVNTSTTAGAAIGYRLRGAGAAASAPSSSAPLIAAAPPAAVYAATVAQERAGARTHGELLAANAELLERQGAAFRARARSRIAALVEPAALPKLGDVLPVKIPLDFGNTCSLASAAQIGGRVAYVGTRAVILEDTLAPLRAQNDDLYRTVGEEFDNVMWPILTANYGNPLVLDPELDNNGRLFMVFSPRINTVAGGGVAGFVTASDFMPAQSCPAGNNGEYFYARVPTRAGGGFDNDNSTVTADEWLRVTRTVIIHEVKHITSYAHKLRNVTATGFFSRDAWLEEATAMVAEELWARTVYGYGFRSNVGYDASLYCEVRPSNTSCAGKPVAMFDHFYWLSEFAGGTEVRSPVGDPSDASVYGSGWLFLRWLLDQFAGQESDILRPLTTEVVHAGVESVEARVTRPFSELITDWALAFALDDYPDITAAAHHTIPSWNLRDVYSRLNQDFSAQGFFLHPYPLRARSAGFGKFLIDVSSVRGGSMSLTEVSGSQSERQLFEFKGLSGTEFPANMRISIVRVQ